MYLIKHRDEPLYLLLPKSQPVFKKISYFCCYVSLLDSLRYFWCSTVRLVGTKQEYDANAMLAAEPSGLIHTDGQMVFPET